MTTAATTHPAAHNINYLPESSNMGNWKSRHVVAINNPNSEESIAPMLRAWVDMAVKHRKQHESPIGEDYYARDHWAAIGVAMHYLLSMSLGRLDGGTLSSIIIETLSAEGYDYDMQEWRF